MGSFRHCGSTMLFGMARRLAQPFADLPPGGVINFRSGSLQRRCILGPEITSELIRAARALLRWEQRHLSEASSVSLPTIKRLEAKRGILAAHHSTVAALKRALESAGVEFTNGASPGVRLRPAPKDTASKTIPNALKILRRAGVGNSPIKGDELPPKRKRRLK
jgi:hypothetical protein